MCDSFTEPCTVPPHDTDTVADFRTLQQSELTKLRERIGLRLSPARLAMCAAMYRSLHRETTVGELRFLDAVLCAYDTDLTKTALAALQTTDADIAAALSDLIEKSKTVQGQTPLLTPHTALRILPATQKHADPFPPLADAHSGARFCLMTEQSLCALPTQGQLPQQSIQIGDTPWRLAITVPCPPYRPTTLVTGDLCSLLTPPACPNEPESAQLIDWFSRSSVKRRIRRLCPVTAQDLIPTLLSLANGWHADLSAIDGLAERAPADAAADLPAGYLICADEKDTKALLDEARLLGWKLSAFARVTADRQLTLTTHGNVNFSLPVAHLRSLLRHRPIEVQLESPATAAGESRLATDTLTLTPIADRTVAHLTLPLTQPIAPADVSHAVAALERQLVTLSADMSCCCVAVGIVTAPSTPPEALWSVLLGLHRALHERKIPVLPPMITDDPHAEQGTLTLCLLAKLPMLHADHVSDQAMTEEKSSDETAAEGENP